MLRGQRASRRTRRRRRGSGSCPGDAWGGRQRTLPGVGSPRSVRRQTKPGRPRWWTTMPCGRRRVVGEPARHHRPEDGGVVEAAGGRASCASDLGRRVASARSLDGLDGSASVPARRQPARLGSSTCSTSVAPRLLDARRSRRRSRSVASADCSTSGCLDLDGLGGLLDASTRLGRGARSHGLVASSATDRLGRRVARPRSAPPRRAGDGRLGRRRCGRASRARRAPKNDVLCARIAGRDGGRRPPRACEAGRTWRPGRGSAAAWLPGHRGDRGLDDLDAVDRCRHLGGASAGASTAASEAPSAAGSAPASATGASSAPGRTQVRGLGVGDLGHPLLGHVHLGRSSRVESLARDVARSRSSVAGRRSCGCLGCRGSAPELAGLAGLDDLGAVVEPGRQVGGHLAGLVGLGLDAGQPRRRPWRGREAS